MDMFRLLQTFGPMAGARPGGSRMVPPPVAARGPLAPPDPMATVPPVAGMGAPAAPEPMGTGTGFSTSISPDAAASMARTPNAAPPPRRGPLGGVGDFLSSDEGKGALFRASAQLLGGGTLGDAAMAGANHVDARRREATEQERYDRDEGQQDRTLDISDRNSKGDLAYKAGTLELGGMRHQLDIATLAETQRKAMAGEQLTAQEQAQLQQWRAVQANLERDAIAQRERDSQRDYGASIYGTDKDYEASTYNTDVDANTAFLDDALQHGPTRTTTNRDAEGNVTGTTSATAPRFNDYRRDAAGNWYVLNPATGQPVQVPPPTQFRDVARQ